ncbi:TauD/TfdA family dioxygenase [Thioalkalicoccus limnaeus]|uniref:TauD/TfdA family dioxygenase n=1 Tax=Thioalkalicoccus limnaeus TaxID=120681 RepID=A0ABV4BCM9_9GAMM
MPNRHPLADDQAYRAWRASKLAHYPEDLSRLRVKVARLSEPTRTEIAAIAERLAKCNMALIDCENPRQVTPSALLRFGHHLGLRRTDSPLNAGTDAVSQLKVEGGGAAGDYIPYTNRPLSWHTDGYYNTPSRAVRSWMLFCVQDAVDGGENALLDPEIAYLRLRDQNPELIATLMAPDVLTIPANVEGGRTLREVAVGPVFSWPEGRLHMRYTARKQHVRWAPGTTVEVARDALTRLFSHGDTFMYRHKLKPGEGYVTHNVLHNRSGFENPAGAGRERVLLRVRYLDRVAAEFR